MKKYMKPRMRQQVIITLSVLLLVSAGITWWRFNLPLEVEKDIPVYNYTQEAQVNYLVHFRANELLDEVTAGPGRGYISSLTDYVETNLDYRLIGDYPAEVHGTVEASARLTGYLVQSKEGSDEKEKVVIWEKTQPLLSPTPYSSFSSQTEIKRMIPIYLNQYREYTGRINTAFFNPTNTVELAILYNVTASVYTNHGISCSQVCPRLVIPIQGNTFAVYGSPNDKKNQIITIKKMVQVPGAITKRQISAGTTIILTLLLLLVLLITKAEIEDPAETELRTIMKLHGMRIVAVEETALPAAFAKRTIHLRSFFDLVKAADEVAQPILYENSHDRVHSFYILNGAVKYHYCLEIGAGNAYRNQNNREIEIES